MILALKHGLKASSIGLMKNCCFRSFTAEPINDNEALIRNCLQTGLGFTPEAVSTLAGANPNFFKGTPADTKIPGIWSTMQRYGMFNAEKFRALCLKEPKITTLDSSHVDLLLKSLEEYGILQYPEFIFDAFMENPGTVTKSPERTKRLLYVMYRLIQCERQYIGELVIKIPKVLLASVSFCLYFFIAGN